MKHLDQVRNYRRLCSSLPGEISYQVVIEQSDLFVISSKDLRSQILDRLYMVRRHLKGFIFLNPEFAESLVPVKIMDGAPQIVKDMAKAASLFGVGPMAAVAGAIAQDIADHMHHECPEILVENGGDVFIHSKTDRTVGLLPHPEEPVTLGIKITKEQLPCAVCSSSSTIGHSLSLGNGDLVTVLAGSGAVADAAATALCNILHSKKSLKRINELRPQLEKKGIRGVLAQMGSDFTAWGDVELVMV